MNKTTELLKEIRIFKGCNNYGLTWSIQTSKPLLDFHCGEDIEGDYHYCFKCSKILFQLKSELKGHLEAMKEEVEFLKDDIFNYGFSVGEEGIACITFINKRLKSLQEEIKLVKGGI